MSNRGHAVRTAMARSHLYIIKTPARKASALRAGVCNYFTNISVIVLLSLENVTSISLRIGLVNIGVTTYSSRGVISSRKHDVYTYYLVHSRAILRNGRELYIVVHTVGVDNGLHVS